MAGFRSEVGVVYKEEAQIAGGLTARIVRIYWGFRMKIPPPNYFEKYS